MKNTLKSLKSLKKHRKMSITKGETIYNDKELLEKWKKGGLLAPNGKKSNLTPEQYKMVRTPQFKAWFGDWENDPQNASKVVDENGEPLVVYHGTYAKDKFNVFDFNKADLGFHFGTYEQAKDRSETKIGIKDFKQFIEPFFLNIRTLFVINDAIEFEYPQSYINDLFKRNIITEQEINENGLKGFTIKQSNEIIRNLLVEKYNNVGFKYENKIEGEGYSYIVCEPKQIKLADGTNTTFEANNPDISFEEGGTIESKFYNGLYIGNDGTYRKSNNFKEGGNMELNIESKLSISDIDHKYPNLPHHFINKQLIKGIKVEMEHTDNTQVARKIALDHLLENPFYYEYLDKMEDELKSLDIDKHFQEIQSENYYAKGGNLEAYEFNTPSGIESKLSYIQQVLVRTKAFKNWFGDWELAAKTYLIDGKQNFNKHYQNVSKVIDMETLEPKVGYHGTKEEEEFYSFATNKETGAGRPYGYFAENREYSMNFVGRSNLLYAAFLNIRNPFIARGINFTQRKLDWMDASVAILTRMASDRYTFGSSEYLDEIVKLTEVHKSQIWDYLRKTYENENYNFWLLMARDFKSEFKNFLISHGYDGIFADEQFKDPYDAKDPSQFTNTFIIFDASQVKLADGRNLKFNPMSADIRYEKGAKLDMPYEQEGNSQVLSKGGKMRALLLEHKYKSGGALQNVEGVKDDAKEGGLFIGQSHANGGIKAYNVSTQKPIEVEGGEVIITKKAVDDNEKREFEGEMLTNKEILSRINESGGGVSFAHGGQIHGCGCSGKKYNYGGETLEDYMIIKKMNDAYDMTLGRSVSYANNLMNKLK